MMIVVKWKEIYRQEVIVGIFRTENNLDHGKK